MLKFLSFFFILGLSYTLEAQQLTTYFDYKVFQVPGEGMLLETYFDTKGASLHYQPKTDSTHQATIEIKLIAYKSKGIKDFRKIAVKGPEAPLNAYPDFISIQHFLLPKGMYSLQGEIRDLHSTDSIPETFDRIIDLEFNSDRKAFSDIQLLAGFKPAESNSETAKAGIDMLPYMSNVYGEEFGELLFYAELYAMDDEVGPENPYLLTYFLEDSDYERVQESTKVMKRKKAGSVHAELGLIDISMVPTGTYNLRLEARNRDLELLAFKETPIVRINSAVIKDMSEDEVNRSFVGSISSKDTLMSYIHCLRPIADDAELEVVDQEAEDLNLIDCKRFFYSFWETRDPLNPSEAWFDYRQEVNFVEEKFATSNRAGYETDMGRIYLEYGPPNSIANEANDPEAYPYQIWHYYKAGRFNDRRFVFYDRELLGREYVLLHSDVPGEAINSRWNIIINSRNNAMWNNQQNSGSGTGTDRLQERYENPY